jgi:hypothetical protein
MSETEDLLDARGSWGAPVRLLHDPEPTRPSAHLRDATLGAGVVQRRAQHALAGDADRHARE